ncbi:MAG: helix-turn-helix domain-containing protein [Zoogloeaceae bacterium]|nr:helix-turn-helix domain-containing protein [Zoogloeaceae bacterium]
MRRLIERGSLPVCRIGRLMRVPSEAVREFIAQRTEGGHNVPCAVSETHTLRSKKSWSTDAKIPRSIGVVSQTQAARELDALLARQTCAKRKPSKASGNSKRIR